MYRSEVYRYINEHKGYEIMLHIDDPHDKKGGWYVAFNEGTGDNLLREDVEQGFVDYIDYCTFRFSLETHYDPEFIEDYGGMILLKKLYQDMNGAEIFECLNRILIIPEDVEVTVLT